MLAGLAWPTAASARDVVVTSFDGAPIVAHFFPAAGLQPDERQPTVLFGAPYATHGAIDPDGVSGERLGISDMRNAGFNVLTWDPRGFGGSGGTAQFDSPAFEGRDVQALIDYVATAPEALLDGPGDPRVGMAGSSYGGGIQFVAAAIDQRVDAIVPDIAWNSLVTSFAKDGAFKAGWLLGLCANGEVLGFTDGFIDGLTSPAGVQLGSTAPQLRTLCVEGNLLGALSATSRQWLADRGPGTLVGRIRAPTLITQGTVDTLFPPGEAIANYDAAARQRGAREDALVLRRARHVHDAGGRYGRRAATRRAGLAATLAEGRRHGRHRPALCVDRRRAGRGARRRTIRSRRPGSLTRPGAGRSRSLPSPTVTIGPIVLAPPVLELRRGRVRRARRARGRHRRPSRRSR